MLPAVNSSLSLLAFADTTHPQSAEHQLWSLMTLLRFAAVSVGAYLYTIVFPERRVLQDSRHYYSDWKIRLYTSLPLKLLSTWIGILSRIEVPMYLRKPLYGFYADLFDCKMYEAREEDLESYSSFATFFRRTLKDGVRPIDSAMLVSPADGTVMHFGEVRHGRVECVKGHDYDITDFLGPTELRTQVSRRLTLLFLRGWEGFHCQTRLLDSQLSLAGILLLSLVPTCCVLASE